MLAFTALASPAERAGQMDSNSSVGIRRDDPLALANAGNVLAAHADLESRRRVLAALREKDRPAWAAIAAEIGLSAKDLESLLASRAQRQLLNEHRAAQCWLNADCDPFSPIDGWVDPRDDLPTQLGRSRFDPYQQFITARDERQWFGQLQRRLPPADPLTDQTIELIEAAFAEGRARFATEARQDGFTVQALITDQPVAHLWSGYRRGATDEYQQRRQSAARYAGWLRDVAARYLSATQLAQFRVMLEQELAAYQAWLPLDAMRQAALKTSRNTRLSGVPKRPPRKDPGSMAYADSNLNDQDYLDQQLASLTRKATKYWTERAEVTLLRLAPRELEHLAQQLGELEFRQKVDELTCTTDPDCDEAALQAANREARSGEAAKIMGPEEYAQFMHANWDDAQPYYRVHDFRSGLPDNQQLSLDQARQLAELISAEEKRSRSPVPADAPTDTASRLAAAVAHYQRLHDSAAQVLDREQLRAFDAFEQKELASIRQQLQAMEPRP